MDDFNLTILIDELAKKMILSGILPYDVPHRITDEVDRLWNEIQDGQFNSYLPNVHDEPPL